MSSPEEWYEGWRRGEQDSFLMMYQWLWENLYSVQLAALLRMKLTESLCRQFVNDAFQKTMLELDKRISGGSFSAPKAGGTIAPNLEPVEWRSEVEFKSFVRRRWINRCSDEIRSWSPWDTVPLENENEVQEPKMQERFEEWSSTPPDAIARLARKDHVVGFVTEIACVSECMPPQSVLRLFSEGVVLYLKCKVAECNITKNGLSVAAISRETISRLVENADLSAFCFNRTDLRKFLRDTLEISENGLSKRTERWKTKMRQNLLKLPLTPLRTAVEEFVNLL